MNPGRRTAPEEQRRQRRADARTALLQAARDLLERHRWHELPVEELTSSAGLSRTVFYRHFADRRELLLALLADTGEELAATGALWQRRESDDPVADIEEAARALTRVFRLHGRLIQAFADAAADDAEVRTAYERLGADLAEAVAARFTADATAGTGTVVHVREVARALVWMNERYLLSVFGHRAAGEDEAEAAVAALTEIWSAVAYGRQKRG